MLTTEETAEYLNILLQLNNGRISDDEFAEVVHMDDMKDCPAYSFLSTGGHELLKLKHIDDFWVDYKEYENETETAEIDMEDTE